MSSVEGMWALLSGSVNAPDDMRDGGIVVLETGRVFGGDSAMAYLGTYEFTDGTLNADVRSWKWNMHHSDTANVFGMTGHINHQVVFEGIRDGDRLKGFIAPADAPESRLRAVLVKITDLP